MHVKNYEEKRIENKWCSWEAVKVMNFSLLHLELTTEWDQTGSVNDSIELLG